MPRRRFTEAEYLTIERASEFKSEYLDGGMYAMAGAGRSHIRIVENFSGLLYNQLRHRPCEYFTSEMKVRVGDSGLYAYPDVAALCGEVKVLDDRGDVLLNPQMIIEVLSPSTAAYDQGEKAERYRRLDSLTDYLLVEQNRMFVRHWTRQDSDTWSAGEYDKPSDRVRVEALEIEFVLAEVYEKVTFSSPPPVAAIRVVR